MSEPEPRDELPPLPDDVQAYVDAFAARQQPPPRQQESTWAAIEEEIGPPPRRVGMLELAIVVAIAAALVLVFSLRGDDLQRDVDHPRNQASWASEARESAGTAQPKRATDRSPERGPARREPPPPAPPTPVPQTPSEAPTAVPPSTPSPSPSRPPHRTRRPPSSPKPSAAPEPAEPSLAEELALFRRATLMVERDPARALELLERHRQRFPQGTLRTEGQVLRARALCALGRTEEATRLRDGFIAQHPGSALATRMRSVCR
ncbi:MAG: hypothetical protein AAF799_08445 [Myxococcota bacterium]